MRSNQINFFSLPWHWVIIRNEQKRDNARYHKNGKKANGSAIHHEKHIYHIRNTKFNLYTQQQSFTQHR